MPRQPPTRSTMVLLLLFYVALVHLHRKIGSTDDQPLQHRVSMIRFGQWWSHVRTHRSAAPLLGCFLGGLFSVVECVGLPGASAECQNQLFKLSVQIFVWTFKVFHALRCSSSGPLAFSSVFVHEGETSFARSIPNHQNRRVLYLPFFSVWTV